VLFTVYLFSLKKPSFSLDFFSAFQYRAALFSYATEFSHYGLLAATKLLALPPVTATVSTAGADA